MPSLAFVCRKKESGCSVKPFFAGCALPFRGILMYSIAHGKAPILIIMPLECYQHSQGQSISISQIIPQSLSIGYLKGASVWYILLLQVKSLFLMKQINFLSGENAVCLWILRMRGSEGYGACGPIFHTERFANDRRSRAVVRPVQRQ
jgi:hypothetical protein